MSCMIGQVSYLPEVKEIRKARKAAAWEQIEWFREILPSSPITCVAQNYHEGDCVKGVSYIRLKNPVGPGAARNYILKDFYESDYDWLLLCDDDTTAYDRYSYKGFIKDLVNHPMKFEGVDAVSAVEPEYHPYKKLNFADKNTTTHYKFEPRELNSGSATSFIRNIRKYHGKELYFENINAETGEGREDMEFLFAWLKSGLTWYTMQTWIRKSLCFDKSSIFGYNVEERDKILQVCLDNICKKYADDGLMRTVGGKITWKNFNDRYNKSMKVLYIPRAVPIEYKPEDIPATKKSNNYSLF